MGDSVASRRATGPGLRDRVPPAVLSLDGPGPDGSQLRVIASDVAFTDLEIGSALDMWGFGG